MNIKVVDMGYGGHDVLYVMTPKTRLCRHDVDVMAPKRGLNVDCYVCEECGGLITDRMNNDYNRYWGYSGYDEYYGEFDEYTDIE